MDQSLLDLGSVGTLMELPTSEGADALLRDDPPADEKTDSAVLPDLDSPTAAVKSAIGAKIAEQMHSEIFLFDTNISNDKDIV